MHSPSLGHAICHAVYVSAGHRGLRSSNACMVNTSSLQDILGAWVPHSKCPNDQHLHYHIIPLLPKGIIQQLVFRQLLLLGFGESVTNSQIG